MATPPRSPKRTRKPSRRLPAHGLWGKDTLLIERMSQEGRGIASRDDKIVFVSGALIGEHVQVQCTAAKRDYDEAEMIALEAGTAPAELRVTPPCPIYPVCGGCSLQHWSLEAQRQHKQTNLLAMLQALAPLEAEPPILGQPAGFRHRLRLLVTRLADRSYALALRQRRSHEAVELQQCHVANAVVNHTIQALPGLLQSAPDLQGLREIEIDADSDDNVGLCFYFAANPGEKTLRALRDAVLVGPVVALRVRLNTQRPARRDAPGDAYDLESGAAEQRPWQELLAEGELCLRTASTEPGEAALTLAYQPGDFTQTNWDVNAALVERAMQWLQPGADDRALDLFAGIGNFSLPLARSAKSVHAFESDASMSLRVFANAARNGIANVRATTLDLMTDELVLPKADIAIVDPPRAGAKAVCEALARAKLKRIVYISCHPATLLRDARILHNAGYRPRKAAAVDMFPHTGHSEAIVLFQRR